MGTMVNKTKILSSLFWKLMERGGTQGIQFIVQVILARLLLPEDYGIIAMIAVFITLANVFVQTGFNVSLIQKKEADETDFSSVLVLCLSVATGIYIFLFFTAPVIASFYQEPKLIAVFRVLSITLFPSAVISLQNAYIARNMYFKKLFFSSLAGITVSGITGIVLAYAKLGVWALVAQQLVNQFITLVILWHTIKWRPLLVFSFKRVKRLFSYGWKLLASNTIDTLYMELQHLVVGKIFNPAVLGFFNRGKQFPSLIVENINGAIQSVMLPALSTHQDDNKRVREMVRHSIAISSFIIFPMMVGLGVTAEPIVLLLLTEKWLPAVPFLRIFCASYALWPIHTANLQAINALGRSDIFLKLEIIKKIIGVGLLLVSIPYGVYAIALSLFLSGILSTFINAYPNAKLLEYSYLQQLKDIMPSFMLSVGMGLLVYCIKLLGFNSFITLIFQVFVGIVMYFGVAWAFKLESFVYLSHTFDDLITKKRKKTSFASFL